MSELVCHSRDHRSCVCACDQHISMNCHGLYKHCWELVLMEYEQYIPMSEVRSSVHDLYIPIPPGISLN